MGGARIHRIQRLYSFFLAFLIVFSGSFTSFIPRAKAYSPLELPKDLINSTTPGRGGVGHDISFILPASSQQIAPSDWVLIQLTNFLSLSAITDKIGGFGNPIYSVSGNTLRVTNMVLLPGTKLELLGATAQNPQSGQSFEVIIKIAEGSAGGLVRNQAITYAGEDGSFVSVSANIDSLLSAVNITGYTSPGAFTTLTENAVAVGTTVASGSGSFAFPIGGLDPGSHTYRISSTDINGLASSQTVLTLFLISATVTTATGILLSPTLALDKTEILPGDTLTISGSAKPLSQINLFTESPLRSYSTTTDSNGLWTYLISSAESSTYPLGEHRAYANVQDDVGNQSLVSPTISFLVKSADNGSNPPPSCDISHGDLNCDTKTNLTDFSILLFHWKTNHKKADINNDGTVNLVDFSIMMFYFRR